VGREEKIEERRVVTAANGEAVVLIEKMIEQL
jgi:hypothetical protein